MLLDLLKEINSKISELEGSQQEYILPASQTSTENILNYLEFQEVQREVKQQIQDLVSLRKIVQTTIDKTEAERQEQEQTAIQKARLKQQQVETRKLVKQLKKSDPCSPEAANQLLQLSIMRRQ